MGCGKFKRFVIFGLLAVSLSIVSMLVFETNYELLKAGEKQQGYVSFSKIHKPLRISEIGVQEKKVNQLTELSQIKYISAVPQDRKSVDARQHGYTKNMPRVKDNLTLIKEARDKRKISKKRYLLLKADAIFKPEKLPKEFKGQNNEGVEHEVNLTEFIDEIKQEWGNLDDETQRQLGPILLRPTDDFDYFEDGNIAYDMTYHVSEQEPYDTTHFRIHYVSSTPDAPSLTDDDDDGVFDYVEQMGDVFEFVYEKEIDSMGFSKPPSDGSLGGNGKTDVYLKELLSVNVLGYTAIDNALTNLGKSQFSFIRHFATRSLKT